MSAERFTIYFVTFQMYLLLGFIKRIILYNNNNNNNNNNNPLAPHLNEGKSYQNIICPLDRSERTSNEFKETCGQQVESFSHTWISRPRLPLQISSHTNSSRCWLGTEPHGRVSNPVPLREGQRLYLCATVADFLILVTLNISSMLFMYISLLLSIYFIYPLAL